MSKTDVILQLKEQTARILNSEKEFWISPGLSSGIAKGIVVELLGNAKTEWLIQVLIANPTPYIFWCEKEQHILPTAIAQRGLQLNRVKFVITDKFQALRLALESQQYPFVVAPNFMTSVSSFQRLHLLAEKSKSTIFLLGSKKFSSAWPISLQLDISESDNGFEIYIQKQKHGRSL